MSSHVSDIHADTYFKRNFRLTAQACPISIKRYTFILFKTTFPVVLSFIFNLRKYTLCHRKCESQIELNTSCRPLVDRTWRIVCSPILFPVLPVCHSKHSRRSRLSLLLPAFTYTYCDSFYLIVVRTMKH